MRSLISDIGVVVGVFAASYGALDLLLCHWVEGFGLLAMGLGAIYVFGIRLGKGK